MKRQLILPLIAAATILPASAESYEVKSPDGKTVVTVSDEGLMPTYSVKYNGTDFLLDSPLGLRTNIGDFTAGLNIGKVRPAKRQDSYSIPNIKKSKVDYEANTTDFTFCGEDGTPVFELQVEVSDNNVAYRYVMLPQKETLSCVVESEASGFVMPDGTTTFLCPQMQPMTGFARTAPSYETNYDLGDSMGKNGW
ncbi:MAG: glycoside hydrolase family 97 N-terminal domain-containing protein, partial [Muribaculaceae bacterium]|nr:glycoside hydrolase family 97 N-terminal domain-containing protein [Muribaculaceae bacterium]